MLNKIFYNLMFGDCIGLFVLLFFILLAVAEMGYFLAEEIIKANKRRK